MEKQHTKFKSRSSLRARKLVALACTIAVWFSFNVCDSLQASQSDFAISAAPATSQISSVVPPQSADSLLATSSGVAVVAITIITIVMLAYSVLSSGKQGWGWVTLCIVASIIMVLARLGIALFREISSANSIQDWDS